MNSTHTMTTNGSREKVQENYACSRTTAFIMGTKSVIISRSCIKRWVQKITITNGKHYYSNTIDMSNVMSIGLSSKHIFIRMSSSKLNICEDCYFPLRNCSSALEISTYRKALNHKAWILHLYFLLYEIEEKSSYHTWSQRTPSVSSAKEDEVLHIYIKRYLVPQSRVLRFLKVKRGVAYSS